jgi:hypothetical protein
MNVFLLMGALAVLAACGAVILRRKRAARRAAAERARLRARRRKVPVVSANLRGLEYRQPAIRFDDGEARDA